MMLYNLQMFFDHDILYLESATKKKKCFINEFNKFLYWFKLSSELFL